MKNRVKLKSKKVTRVDLRNNVTGKIYFEITQQIRSEKGTTVMWREYYVDASGNEVHLATDQKNIPYSKMTELVSGYGAQIRKEEIAILGDILGSGKYSLDAKDFKTE